MKKLLGNCFKSGLIILVILSSGLALYIQNKGSAFDPVTEILKLKDENRRDEALDMAVFFDENQVGDPEKIQDYREDLEYTILEKIESACNGAIRGEVYDTYSGLGAILMDLCIIGDVRDLGIQSWKYHINDPDFDEVIMIFSASGVGLSSTAFVNGTNALAKNTVKYLKRIPALKEKGLLRRFLSGKMSPDECEKIWGLLKKTNGVYPKPHPAFQVSIR